MPKDENQYKRIEGVFGMTGLGNTDPEKLEEFIETYEKVMTSAERVRKRKKGKKFADVLTAAEEEPKEQPS